MKKNKLILLMLVLSFLVLAMPVYADDFYNESINIGGATTSQSESYSLGARIQIVCNNCSQTDTITLRNVITHADISGYDTLYLFEDDGTTVLTSATWASVVDLNYTLGTAADVNLSYYRLAGHKASGSASIEFRTGTTMPQTFSISKYISRCYATGPNAANCPNADTTRWDFLQDYELQVAAAPPAPGSDFAYIEVKNLYDDVVIEGLTVYEGSLNNVTDVSGIAQFNDNDGLNFTVDGGALYFDVSGTAVQNGTFNTTVYGAFPLLEAYDLEGTAVNTFNVTGPLTSNTTSSGSANLLLNPNVTTELNFSALNYYFAQKNVTTVPQDTNTYNITGLYQTIVTVNATNAYNGVPLVNFTGWIYNNVTGFNASFNDSGTGTATMNAVYGLHTVYIDVEGYSLSAANYDQATYATPTYGHSFNLYSNNSILITIKDQETNLLITENVTVTLTSNTTETTYSTTNGTLFIDDILDDAYTVGFAADNYTSNSYEVTVADRSTQLLNAFLTPSATGTNNVVFAILDFDNGQSIEGATIIQQRLLNATWTTISTKTSDITGRAQFSYVIGVKYRFTVSSTGFNSKVFELDPIIFTSYFIRLEKDLILDTNNGLFDVTLTYFPSRFINDENNTFTFTFGSPNGTLESYGYTLTYPGGTHTRSGTNANGGTLSNTSFLITGAGFTDRVQLTYWYDSVYGENKTYSTEFLIDNAADPGTLFTLKQDDYGLGTVKQIFIAIICTLIFAGVLNLFGGALFGVVGAVIALGFFTIIGFLSIWITLPSILVSFLLLARRSTE